MAVRSKVGLSGDGFIEGKPKKSRQGNVEAHEVCRDFS